MDYWTDRFRLLMDENKSLKGLLKKSQQHIAENRIGPILDDNDCINQITNNEYHKLKLDLLIKQMEHLKLLDGQVKIMDQISSKKKVFSGNNHFKFKYTNNLNNLNVIPNGNLFEKKDDYLIDILQSKIDFLNLENEQLHQLFGHIEKQILREQNSNLEFSSQKNENPEYLTLEQLNSNDQLMKRYNVVRQLINQMMAENEELKSKIARYRWTNQAANYNLEINSNQSQANTTNNETVQDKDKILTEKAKQMEQLRIRLVVLHRQLMAAMDEKKMLQEKHEILMEKNKYLEKQLQQFNNAANQRSKPPTFGDKEKNFDFKLNAENLLNYGKNIINQDWFDQTLKQVQTISEQFSSMFEESLQVFFNDLKSAATLLSLQSSDENEKGYQSNWMKEKNSWKPGEDEKQFRNSMKRLKKLRKKYPKLLEQDWLMRRALSREKARIIKFSNWLIQRANARENSRTKNN